MANENNENENFVYERKESFFESFKRRLTQLRIGPPGGVRTTNRSMESLMNSGSITGFFRNLFDKAQDLFAAKPDKNPNKIEVVSVGNLSKDQNTQDITKTQDPEKPKVIVPGQDKTHSQTVPLQTVPDVADIVIDEAAQAVIIGEASTELESSDNSNLDGVDIAFDDEFQEDLAEIDKIDEALRKMEAQKLATQQNANQKNIIPKQVGTPKKSSPSQEGQYR